MGCCGLSDIVVLLVVVWGGNVVDGDLGCVGIS